MATEFPIGANTNPAVKDIDKLIAALRKAGKEAGMTEKEIDDITHATKKAGTEGVKNVGNINKSFNNLVDDGIKKVGGAIVAAFAFDRLVQFGKQVIAITAEFQKFEAVLTNSLGSKSRAKLAMAELSKFASQTPFSVQQLTSSFVKLVNQGFIPTNEQLRKLGDLAASTGKEFDMLTEAIIDAQTGEFERLKEFGIRASKAGDQVTFTFKGVETQTKFTSEAIREYVLSLGDAVGVSGSMAAISETLGGKISNMGDAWDTFMVTLGDGQRGPLSNAVKNLTKLIELATRWSTTDEQTRVAEQTQVYNEQREAIKKLFDTTKDLDQARDQALSNWNAQLKLVDMQLQEVEKSLPALAAKSAGSQAIIFAQDYADALLEQSSLQNRYNDLVNDGAKAIKEFYNEVKNQKPVVKTINEITAAEKELIDQRKKAREEFEKNKGSQQDFGSFDVEVRASDLMNQLLLSSFFVKEEQKTNKLKEEAEKRKKLTEEEAEAEKKKNDEIADANEFAHDIEMQAINALFDARSQAIENELSLNEQQRTRELELAGDNEEAKDKINKKFDQKQRALQSKQAQVQQQQALFNMAVNLGPSIAKTVSTLGFPAAIPFIAAIGVLFTTLMAKQKSVNVPKFATGVYDLQGPGTGTSDSIDARLSKGESVADAETTNKFGDILKPMIENEFFDYADIKNIVDKKLPSQITTVIIPAHSGADNPRLLEEIRDGIKALKNKRETHLDIDQDGFLLWTQQGRKRTNYVNKRYKI